MEMVACGKIENGTIVVKTMTYKFPNMSQVIKKTYVKYENEWREESAEIRASLCD